MSRFPPVARHERAGRLEGRRLGVRFAAGAEPERSGEGDPLPGSLVEGRLAPGTQRAGPFELRLAVDAGGDAAGFDLTVRNVSEAPLWLEAVVLGFRWSGVDTSALRFLRHGWQSWSFTGPRDLDDAGEPAFPSGPWLRGLHHGVGSPPPDRAGWHESDLLTVAGAPDGAACLAGVLERGEGTGLVYLRRDGDGILVEVEVRFETALAAGTSREVERVRVALGVAPERLLEEHAAEHGRVAGARTAGSFQAGWCTWYHFFHDVDEAALLRNLDALAARRSEFPIDLVQLDDGYQRAIGDWLETNAKFPRGLAPLAGAIRDAGFRAGIWLAPFCVVRESRLFDVKPAWLLRRGDDWLRGLLHPMWTPDASVYVLDPSRAEVRDHLVRVAAALVGLGFSYLKLDFLYVAALEARAADPGLSRAGRLRRGLEAIRAGAGEETFLLGCGCPLGAAVGVVDGMRIGPDVAPSWGPAGVPIPGIEATVPSTRNALRNVVGRAWAHRRLWLNDPDCLMARTRDTGLTPDEVHSLAALIAASGGMVVFSDDVPSLGAEEAARVAESVALAREVDDAGLEGTSRALDLLGAELGGGLAARTASGALVALVNAADAPRDVEADLGRLGVPARGLAGGALLGTAPLRLEEGRLRARLGAHESAFARLLGEPVLAVFCDFDGTFAVQDVGSTLARRYAAERRAQLWKRLERGELRAWEYNLELLDGLPLPEEELDAFLRQVELDPGAKELVSFCEHEGLPFRVLSDGFDRNLDRIQELTGVRFAYDANRLWYEKGRWRIAAGSPDPSCECGTGLCKRSRIRAFRALHPGATVVHIGNGRVSDLCAVAVADVVFAKDTLAEELERQGVGFERFETLHEVVAGLQRLLARLAGARRG
jgi:alpha-galactosidase